MAEKQMEEAQRARRKTSDFDYDSDDVSSVEITPSFSESSSATSSSIRQRGSRSSTKNPMKAALFDPYAPLPSQATNNNKASQDSLFDATAFELSSMLVDDETRASLSSIPGGAGYLEIEEEPPRPTPIIERSGESIQTSSGLLLTHRRSSPSSAQQNHSSRGNNNNNRDYFEVEHGSSAHRRSPPHQSKYSSAITQATHLMSYVKVWVAVCFFILLVATGALMHSFGHNPDANVIRKSNSNSDGGALQYNNDNNNADGSFYVSQQQQEQQNGGAVYWTTQQQQQNQVPEQIWLLPMENISQLAQQKSQEIPRRKLGSALPQEPLLQQHGSYGIHQYAPAHNHRHLGFHHQEEHHSVLDGLRQEFEAWIMKHQKSYHSEQEKEHRFHIWSNNHHRTIEKNRRHGPCKLTKKEVFGSNHLKDLSPEEFKVKFLTGYKGPRTDEMHLTGLGMGMRRLNHHLGKALDPKVYKPMVHESVRHRMLQQQNVVQKTSAFQCKWYDVSCILRWLYNSSGMQFGLIGTMEPKYDADAYPNAVDWRDSGAVTDIRYQGDCGGCWAITAVETVESAHYISTGNLYDLSEAEVIMCETSCSMCDGGWPQNAFQWVMDHGGLPLSSVFEYNSYTLLEMTKGLTGESYTWTEDSISSQRSQVCPADGDGGSQDNADAYYQDGGGENKNYGDYSSQGRYGNIKGFGYATDRCVCYSDGSGCDCDDQDESTAVRNIASYGPAVVCLEASLWQDYSGGIITSELGCGSQFLDMNHCVQTVGYAYTDGSDNEDGEDGENKSGGSQDGDKREGYWIVRNQWGNSWGMSGYAYVAMGENTCGILNDMSVAYM